MLAASGGNFLVPDGTFIAELVGFLLLIWFLGRKVLPPLRKAMEQRQEQIRESLEAAERARNEADETRAERQAILDEARQQARDIVATANATAERSRAEGVERGQQEYDRLVGAAQAEISVARQRAVDEVSAQVGGLVIDVARQVIGREIDLAAHRDLIDEAVAALRASGDTAAARSEG